MTTIEWSWEQWCGRGQTETITETKDIYRECYQRDFIPPPAIELTWIENAEGNLISSESFSVESVNQGKLKHTINLFLELFGECELCQEDFSPFLPPKLHRLNWRLLPPGKHPWDKLNLYVKQLVSHKHERYSKVILDRQKYMTEFHPNEVYVGTGGFRCYIAYVLTSRGLVVLESVLTGNATYVFSDKWMEFASMSKSEILDKHLQEHRVVHSKGWEIRIRDIIEPRTRLAI